MEELVIDVKVCDDCPFCVWGSNIGVDLCHHPETSYKAIDNPNDAPPSWCPLKWRNITIQLNDGVDK